MYTNKAFQASRRDFLRTMGCVTIGFPLLGSCGSPGGQQNAMTDQQLPGSLRNDPKINAWIEVLENGHVRVLTGKIELGQGIQTAIMQVAAEELDMTMDRVEIVMAETGRTPNEGYTAGSRSIETSAMAVRYAAAAAREKILNLASKKMGENPDDLRLKDGIISGKTNQSMSLQEVLEGRQIEDEVHLPVKLKNKEHYQVVGKAIPRREIEKMVKGESLYVQDLRFSGMVHARMIHPRGYGAKLLGVDKSSIQSMPGLLKIVEDGSFLGIIAEEEYQSVLMWEQLKKATKWSDPDKLPVGQSLKEYIRSLPSDSHVDKETGNYAQALDRATVVHKASYSKPYVMHAANGPSCSVALFEGGKLHIWSHSQGVYPLRESIAKMLKMNVADIHIKGVPGSGCYGHNGADDVSAEAALLAVNYPGKHVRLQWMRDDENGWEPYGTFMIMDLEAGLHKNGKITGWQYDLWSDAHGARPGGNPGNLLPAQYLKNGFQAADGGFRGGATRNAEPYYTIANQQLRSHIFHGPLRTSSLRSLGAYANIFAIESFMDELAEKADKDPIEFRKMHLSDKRALDSLKKLNEMTNAVKPGAGEGLGFAFSRYKNTASYCSVAALVNVDKSSGHIQVKKMWAAIDAGEVINTDGLKNQTEGGMVQSASWTLKEAVKFDNDHITSLDWITYPIFRYLDIPETKVKVLDRPSEPPAGAGESAQGPAAAAVANAIYQACGIRVRDLPISPEKIINPSKS